MAHLAPSLCPICDREFQDRHYDDETRQEIWLHYKIREKCVRETVDGQESTRTEPIYVPKI